MQRTNLRLAALFAGLILLLVVAALIYRTGMTHLEGQPRTFMQAFEWASETISTTGYGSDNRWSHPAMVLFVVGVQLIGIFLVPLLVSIYVLPFLAERFEQKVPRAAEEDLEDHVIVYRYGPAVETLLQRLSAEGVPSLVVETDEKQARELMERNQVVVFSRSDDDALDVCRLHAARAIVANGGDQDNAAIVLRARQLGFTRPIFVFVEDPAHRKPMELVGATSAYTPRHIVAAALAAHASQRISPRMPGLEQISEVQRREMRIPVASPAARKTLGDVGVGTRTGAIVVGQWTRGRLDRRCTAATRIEPGGILEVVGEESALQDGASLLGGTLLRRDGFFLIAGFGEVGRKIHELLTDAGEEVRVIERMAGPNVDVVGDVLDAAVLEKAGINEARALILALDSDDATLFGSVIARDLVRDTQVIARVNHGRNLDNIHRAGADYALSISDVSGEMLSVRLLGGGERIREEHRRVVAEPGADYAGRTVSALPFRAEGCSLLAIDREGAPIRTITPDLVVSANDVLWVCRVS